MAKTMFSIIMPTLNSGLKLESTIKSVLSQNAELFEYIIVDGGSTDETLDIIEKYGTQIKWISEKDRGVYDAMNKGIRMARGNYLYFIGAGDHLRENILEKIAGTIPDKPLTFVYGNVFLIDAQTRYQGEVDGWKIRRDNICHQAIFYERTIFDVMGLFDLKYTLLADWAFNIRCFADKRIQKMYVPEVIADYEGGGISAAGADTAFHNDFTTNRDLQTLSAALAEREQTLTVLSTQLAERDRDLERLSADLAKLNRELELQAERDEQRIAVLSVQLLETETELKRIAKTFGWRLLSYFGPIKYRLLLPFYRLFGQESGERTETKPRHDNPG